MLAHSLELNSTAPSAHMAGIADNYTAIIGDHLPYPGSPSQKPMVLTYSFDTEDNTGGADIGASFKGELEEWQKQEVRDALSQYSKIANIDFVETKDSIGDIHLGNYSIAQSGVAGFAYDTKQGMRIYNGVTLADTVAENSLYGLVAFDEKYTWLSSIKDDFGHVAIHEIGHTLGLKHPHEGSNTLPAIYDNGDYTVMSYNGSRNDTLQTYDKTAIKKIYGERGEDKGLKWSFDKDTEVLTQTWTSNSETIRGTRTHDVIHTGGGFDIVATMEGDDTIHVEGTGIRGAGIDINGGSGLDTLVFKEDSDEYSYQRDLSGFSHIKVGSNSSYIYDIERIEFNDQTLAFDIEGTGGQGYRLYNATFDRIPDKPGLGFWIGHLDAGNVTLKQAAYYFMTSEEFTNSFGDVWDKSNSEFLELLYNNILDRDYDQAGFDFWKGHLDNGFTREETLMLFSESPENKEAVDPTLEDGFWFI